MGESQFLTKQAADAKAAISRVTADLQHDLLQAADPRAWMQVHPWATMGTAAVAGFVGAMLAVPSKEQQALRRLRKIEEALTPKHEPVAEAETNGDGVKKAAHGKGFFAGLAGEVLRAVQPVLMSAITAGVAAKTVQPEAPAGGADPSPQPGGDPNI